MEIKRATLATLMMFLSMATPVWAAPQLSASSISVVNNEPWLLYGAGLNGEGLEVLLEAVVPGEDWDAAASLRRVLDGRVELQNAPPVTAARVGIYKADAFTAAVRPWGGRLVDNRRLSPNLAWARTAAGTSAPLAVNRPEIWTMTPRRPAAGERARIFGPNMGSIVCLLSEGGEIRVLDWHMGYSHEKGYSPHFERSVDIPADTAPGQYRLFVNNGGGDYGWSEGLQFVIAAADVRLILTLTASAPGDGENDASVGIQAAIDSLAAAGGGVVYLPAGSYRVLSPIRLKNNVTLRGAGSGATMLLSPRQATLATIFRSNPVVDMQTGSALEHLTIDATSGRENTALLINKASGVSINNCLIVNLDTTDRHQGSWRHGGRVIDANGHISDLRIANSHLRGHNPFVHWGGSISGAYFGHNLMEGLPIHSSTVGMRGLRSSVFEHNLIINGGRGLVLSGEAHHNYLGYNRIENIKGIGNGCEMFLAEMGFCYWQGAADNISADAFDTPERSWDERPFWDGAAGYNRTAWAMVVGGPGMGQLIPVKSAVGNRVSLARPWQSLPEGGSEIAVFFGYVENLHVENQYRDGVVGMMVYGSGARNVWAGDELERTSDGLMLWAISGRRQMSLNLIRDVRMQDRGAVSLISGRNAEDRQVRMFGNEIRTCQVYNRVRYPGNEYGLGNRVWRYRFNDMSPGNARHVTFGDEAGIHLSDSLGWPGGATDDDPRLEEMPAAIRWTLVHDSLVARSPVGLRVGRGIENTVVTDFFSALNHRPVSDSGRGTAVFNPTVRGSKDSMAED